MVMDGWGKRAGCLTPKRFPKRRPRPSKPSRSMKLFPMAMSQLANAAMNLDWDWATEGKEFKRALELNPNSADVRWAYSNYLEHMGRLPEAISEMQLALQLDPISSRAFQTSAFVYYYARQYDQALLQMQRASCVAA